MTHFDAVDIQHILHAQNAHADALTRLVPASTAGIDHPITIEVIKTPHPLVEFFKTHGKDWMKPILDCLTTGQVPIMVKSPRGFHLKASHYTILDGALYKCEYNVPLLHCVDSSTVREMIDEFHQGTCGTHEGLHLIMSRILRYGYYGPCLHQDAKDFVSKCDQCQRFVNLDM